MAQTKTIKPKAVKPAVKNKKPVVAPVAATAERGAIKKFFGVVVSNKMDKTIVVKVETVKIHDKYHKRFTVSKKYKVHDEKNSCQVGDKVTFVACRPLSKDKKWRVLSGR